VDQLDSMRAFAAIAQAGSFSAAARALGAPVASVSRTTRRTALTEVGRRYLETCQRVLAQVDEADRSAASDAREPQGVLTVTAPVAFGRLHVVPVVSEFLRAHPQVDVRLTLADRNLEWVDEGLDVAVRIGALPDSSLVAAKVGVVRRIACASPDYLRRRGTPAQPEDLAAHDCVSFEPLSSSTRWSFPSRRGARAVPIHSRLTTTTADAAVDAAASGLGIARVLSYQAAEAIAAGRLARILERFEPPALPVSVLHAEGRAPRPKVRAFVALATARLRAALR